MNRVRGEIWAALAALMFVGLELSIRAAAPGTPALAGTLVRLLPLVVLAGVVTASRKRHRDNLMRWFRPTTPGGLKVVLALAVDGILNMFLGNVLKLDALQHGGIVITLTAVEVGNLFGAALLARWMVGQAVPPRAFGGLAITAVGTGLAAWTGTLGSGALLPLMLALGAGLSFGLAMTAMGYALKQGAGLWPALAVSSTIGTLVTLAASGFQGLGAMARIPTAAGAELLLSGLFYAAALAFLTTALTRLPVVSTDAITATNGPVAALLGSFAFGGAIGVAVLAGLALVAIGAVIVRTAELRVTPARPRPLLPFGGV
jgi:drug/metabolite transporter (DMT)-like permease